MLCDKSHLNFTDMCVSFTDDLMVAIVEHDNEKVRQFVRSRKGLIDALNYSMYDNPQALSVSAQADNLQAICILMEAGWMDSVNTGLRDAMEKKDFSKAHLLMSFGFSTSCDDCCECGFPNTCALTNSMSSYDKGSESQKDTLLFWCESHDAKDVYQAFSRFLEGGSFNEDRAFDVLDVMDETGNHPGTVVLPPTERNIDFILDLHERGRIDLDGHAHKVAMGMVSQIYSFMSSPYTSLVSLHSILKRFVDAGACVDTIFDVEHTYMIPLVFPDLDHENGLSVRDMVKGFRVDDRDIKRVKRMYARHKNIVIVEKFMKLSHEYIKFKSRQCFFAKRIRGFDSEDSPGPLDERLVALPSEIFGKVLQFLF